MEIAVLMLYLLNKSIYRIPVGVNVRKRHKYGNHLPPVVEIFVFLDLLNNDHLSIGRSYDKIFRFTFKAAYGTTEEVDDNRIDDN